MNRLVAGRPIRLVIMGVSGSGKSEIGRRLAERLAIPYLEGDDDHAPANIAKMAAGTPLDDADRRGWLLALQSKLAMAVSAGDSLVLSCSALRRRYRDALRGADPDLVFIHLDGPAELIAARMQARSGHFMPVSLLDSQCAALEPLAPHERGMRLDIEEAPPQPVDDIVRRICARVAWTV